MQNQSRIVSSSQTGIHKNLSSVIKRHLATEYQQPIRDFNLKVFEEISAIIDNHNQPVILDSGCGTGESTHIIANKYPSSLVIGIDKSSHRLRRSGIDEKCKINHTGNCILARTDIIDFWRLASSANWQLEKHYILYPNPWPKPSQLGRRWHAHPVFPFLISLGGKLELRTNWSIYAEEFSYALTLLTNKIINIENISPTLPISLFEKKYLESEHQLYRCRINLDEPNP